jgi:hypothetical protein
MAYSKKYLAKKAAKEAKRTARMCCPRGDCKCHTGRGLNPWVPACPMCGCFNPKYDSSAQSPYESPLDQMKRQLGL